METGPWLRSYWRHVYFMEAWLYIHVPTFQHALASAFQDGGRSGDTSDHCYARLADSVVVPSPYEEVVVTADYDTKQLPLPARDEEETFSGSKTEAARCALQLEGQHNVLSASARALINKSTRDSTKVKYGCIEKKWTTYCDTNNISSIATTITFGTRSLRKTTKWLDQKTQFLTFFTKWPSYAF